MKCSASLPSSIQQNGFLSFAQSPDTSLRSAYPFDSIAIALISRRANSKVSYAIALDFVGELPYR